MMCGAAGGDDPQSEVFAFLLEPSNWPDRPARVDVIETHGAKVFLGGELALKVKRAVRLPYLDFSTLSARRKFLVRELEINRPFAPEIYLDVIALTQSPDGRLQIGGEGTPVEWAVRMRRFEQAQLMSHVADRNGISRDLAIGLADMAYRYHQAAQPVRQPSDGIAETAQSVLRAIAAHGTAEIAAERNKLAACLSEALASTAPIRERRACEGYVRRCHGDLHLGNIVLVDGKPVPFDAIEFDEAMATIDTLYDLAFLLMDLDRRGCRAAANTVLNRYLWRTGDERDLMGLSALPLYMSLRAAIRAMVALDRARVVSDGSTSLMAHARDTLSLALRHLTPGRTRLVAVGGLSGTGKSTLSALIAPDIGRAPGALHIRTDLERKSIAGVEETVRLPRTAYTEEASDRVYERVMSRARLALEAGQCVIVDGVFAKEEERAEIAALAAQLGVGFHGVWLEASPAVLRHRVGARKGDASDATPEVVDQQLGYTTGSVAWPKLDASGHPEDVGAAARLLLGP